MATFSQNDINLMFLGAAATKTTGGIDSLNVGEIGLFTPGGTRLTESSAATADEFVIVTKYSATADPLVSGAIKKANIKKANVKAHEAATQQSDFIGFNGTSGAIEVVADNFYNVRINLAQHCTSNKGGMEVKHGSYTSDVTATQSEIAAGLHSSLVNNFIKDADQVIKFERLNSHAGVALGTAVGPVNFVKGSKYIKADDIDDATTNAALAVGGYLRVGTAVTDPVYKIVAIDAANDIAELDVAYQGATAEIADTALESISAANEVGTDWGIKAEGQELKFVVGKLHNNVVSYTLGLENFGATALTNAAAASIGSGSERYAKELEWFLQGNEGNYFRMGEPHIFDARATANGGYDMITLTYEEVYTGSITAGPIRKVFTVLVPETAPNYAIAGTSDDITDVLEVLVYGSANGNLAVS